MTITRLEKEYVTSGWTNVLGLPSPTGSGIPSRCQTADWRRQPLAFWVSLPLLGGGFLFRAGRGPGLTIKAEIAGQ